MTSEQMIDDRGKPTQSHEGAKETSGALIPLRPYQMETFLDRTTGLLILFWSRQIGKSYTVAAFAVDRLISRPGRLVTILSNSRDNGNELNLKCAEICRQLGLVMEQEDLSADLRYENMNMETRITVGGKTGRIKVLAANPRTARGFSGDLILDEFAFHENSQAIWEAAEPILSANPDFLCRICSTPNGTHNMFYQMVTCGQYKVLKVRRSDAWKQGLKIYDLASRRELTPDEARSLALDKRAYDQNYELVFADENTTLLTHALISSAESANAGTICEGDWSEEALGHMDAAQGDVFVGVDVGRKHDLTVITALERVGAMSFVRAILRLRNVRLPDQQKKLAVPCCLPRFRRAAIDMTGIGLGLCEYSQEQFGINRIVGINFSSSVPITAAIAKSGRAETRVRVTEAMATELLQTYEDRLIRHPFDQQLRDDLRKPEKVVSPGGRVSIAATRDPQDHADHFWSFALAIEAANGAVAPGEIVAFTESRRARICADRRERALVA